MDGKFAKVRKIVIVPSFPPTVYVKLTLWCLVDNGLCKVTSSHGSHGYYFPFLWEGAQQNEIVTVFFFFFPEDSDRQLKASSCKDVLS